MLLEDGTGLLLEDGTQVLLESGSAPSEPGVSAQWSSRNLHRRHATRRLSR